MCGREHESGIVSDTSTSQHPTEAFWTRAHPTPGERGDMVREATCLWTWRDRRHAYWHAETGDMPVDMVREAT